MDGCLPTLIEWGAQHPCTSLPDCGVQLQSLQLAHADAPVLQQALDAAALTAPHITTTPSNSPAIRATFNTPRGPITLNA